MMAEGLAKLYERGDDWPPSAIGFAKLCRPEKAEITGEWGTGAHKLFQPLALPDKSAQDRAESAGASALEEMKSWNL
ncbi:MAG: hypothetical protein EP324_08150 [Gammaproteobacteria bacterium]|nr:MAG: hypothetical protein EP324_08150 [Gammaproteobacteria bacterium]